MRHARAAVLVAAVLGASSAQADVLGDWTDILFSTAAAARQPAFAQTRTLAMVHVAMFETINAVDARYVPFKVKVVPTPGTSPEAAAAVAAHDVLVALFPAQTPALDASLDISLVRVTDPSIRASSLALGQRVAAAILALRASDGADAASTWRSMTPPGLYVPTALPIGTTWGKVTPWTLEKSDQFHPAAPPALGGAEWGRDYVEVKAVGAKRSAGRTPPQSEAALFWSAPAPQMYTAASRALMDVPGRSLVQNARLLALVSMAQADAAIAVMEAKYAYNFWRPLTAIREGDLDQNDATAADFGWEPFVETPLSPEYPSAQCAGAGAVAAILEKEFGAAHVRSFRLTSPAAPKVTHSWTRLSDFIDEVSNARVWAGVSYRNSAAVGVALGRKVGEVAWEKSLRPLK